jgi:acetyl esterase/lipase
MVASRYPRQLNELRMAVRWIRRNSYRLGVDGGRIGALGSSAGGHLAALLATRTSGSLTAGDRVGAVATWSAPLDLVRPDHASLVPMIQTFLGCRSDVCLRRRAAASPPSHVTRDDPSMLIVNSDEELVALGHARHMAARLSMAGVTHKLWVLPGSRHATMYTATALGPSIEFLRRWLRRA